MRITKVDIQTGDYGKSLKVLLEDKRVVYVGEKSPMFGNLVVGGELSDDDIEIKPGKTYWVPKSRQNGFKKYPPKGEEILKAQENKARHIDDAQSRNETMWAKKTAGDLVTYHPAFQDLQETEILSTIHVLASKIKNDTLEPF